MVSINILKQIGMSEKEAKIYLACLEIGTGTVIQVSRKADITRGSAYDVLEEMLEKGYVSKVHKDRHMVFSAVDPEILMKRTKDNLRDFEMALPELKGLFNKQSSKPKVRYFEGLSGIKRVYEDTLTATTEILNYSNTHEILSHWPTYNDDYVKIRMQKNIFLRGIAQDDEHGKTLLKDDQKYHREFHLLSPKDFKFTNEINIYDNKVAIVSFAPELIGIIIESQAIADTQRDIFKMAWAFAEMNAKLSSVTIKKIKVEKPLEGQPTLL